MDAIGNPKPSDEDMILYAEALGDAARACEIAGRAGVATLGSGAQIGLTPGDVLAHLAKLRTGRRLGEREQMMKDWGEALLGALKGSGVRIPVGEPEGIDALDPSKRRSTDKPHPDDLVRRGDVAQRFIDAIPPAGTLSEATVRAFADSLPCILPGFDVDDVAQSFHDREVPAAEVAPTPTPPLADTPAVAAPPLAQPVAQPDPSSLNDGFGGP